MNASESIGITARSVEPSNDDIGGNRYQDTFEFDRYRVHEVRLGIDLADVDGGVLDGCRLDIRDATLLFSSVFLVDVLAVVGGEPAPT